MKFLFNFKKSLSINIILVAMILVFLLSSIVIASSTGYSFGVKTVLGEIKFEPPAK